MKRTTTYLLLGVLAAAALLPAQAAAGVITATYLGREVKTNLGVSTDRGEQWQPLGGGLFRFSSGDFGDLTGVLGPSSGEFVAMCIDPKQFVAPAKTATEYTFALDNLVGSPWSEGSAHEAINKRKAGFIDRILSAEFAPGFKDATDIQVAALQIILWELVLEQGANPKPLEGKVRVSGSQEANALAAAWIKTYWPKHPHPYQVTSVVLRNGSYQDFLVFGAAPSSDPAQPAAVPAPAPLALLVLGLPLIARLRRVR